MKPITTLTAIVLICFCGLLAGCGGDNNTENNDPVVDESTDISQLVVTINSAPDSITNHAYARFEFAANHAASYQCQLDYGEFDDCTSPYIVSPVGIGDHHLAIRGLDASGATGEETVLSWTVASIFSDANSSAIHADLIETQVYPDPVEARSWRGIFRINCDFAHSSYNDPVVFPGEENAAHLHRFYGNTLADHSSTNESLFTTGESSCQGNLLNLSSYWLPALLAPKYNQFTGERELDGNNDPAWQVVPAVVGNDDEAHEIFYYSAGIDDLNAIQPLPLGLRMIAGNHMSQPGNEQDNAIARWHCQTWESDDSSSPQWSSGIPECFEPDRLRLDLVFPSCWNGVDLDSEDHKSHMAYPVDSGGAVGFSCPDSHPVPVVRVSYHYAFGVKPEVSNPQTRSSYGWKLASDIYASDGEVQGGMSLHGDWVNAWHPEAMQTLLDHCIKQALDCHDGNFANGYRLSGTRAGTQFEPEIINAGQGY
jgi:hypothetical protein